jgi:hypothetical protein
MFHSFRRWFSARHTPIRRAGVRPRLEGLEARDVPTNTFYVNALTDTGTGSGSNGDLRYCVNNASSGDLIDASGITGTITTGSTLTIGVSVEIEGPPLSAGAPQLTVQRSTGLSTPDFSVFTVSCGATDPVTLSGLKIANGRADGSGGGVDVVSGAVTLVDSLVTGNAARTFVNTYMYPPITYPGLGGGAYLRAGSLTLADTTVSGNQAEVAGGGVYLRGGSLTVGGSTVSASTISGNHAGVGGGIAVGGGGAGAGGTVTIGESLVSGNSAQAGAGILTANSSSLTLTDSTVSGNSALSSGYGPTSITGAYPVSYGAGGGVAVGPGGTLTVEQSTISGNSSDWDGGGVYFAGGALSLADSTISGNSNNTNFQWSGSQGTAFLYSTGGGVAIFGTTTGTKTIRNSTIYGNTAGIGGGVGLQYFSAELQVQNCTISGNTAGTDQGGHYYFLAVQGSGGGIDVATTMTGTPPVPGKLTLESTIVSGNSVMVALSPVVSDLAAAQSAGFPGALAILYADYSLIGAADTVTLSVPTPSHNQTGTVASLLDAHLGGLADNGGPTKTCAIMSPSAALNAGDNPTPTVSMDQRGVARSIGTAPDIGAYEYQPIGIANIQVGDGTAQRSEVREIDVTFSGAVAFSGGNGNAYNAFQLLHTHDLSGAISSPPSVTLGSAVTTDSQGRTVVTLTFSGLQTDSLSGTTPGYPMSTSSSLSLADGRYELTVFAGSITDAALGWNVDADTDGTPGGNYVSPDETTASSTGLHLYRIFGDGDGDGNVSLTDLAYFRNTYNLNWTQAQFLAYMDADNSGDIDLTDLNEFRNRYNMTVFI